MNKGVALVGLRRHNDALACYDEAIRRKQNFAEAWSNKGVALHELERHEEALSHFDRAIELNADYVEPWSNKALTLHKLRRFAEALVHCDRAIQLNADFAEAWANKGLTLNDLGRHDEAMAHYECAYRLKPGMDFVLGHLVHTQMVLCDWKGFDLNVSELARKVAMGEPATVPFSLLSAIDSPDLHLKAAQTWVNGRYPGNLSLPAITKSKNQKIRVGYFSADFRHHPVAILTAELFELHDRDRFEIFAFSFGETTQGDEMRKRLVGAFDQFIDVKNRSDADIAQLSRSLNIDIAVDLGGHTKDSRTAIFSHRAAPVQVSYLGYAGSMGAGYIDYLIADRIIVPDSNRQYYAEKIAYLPNSFMVDDSKRQAAQGQPGRAQFSLPAEGIVYCCFNNSYKITPEIFGIWLNILAKVDGSVLWLSGSNDWSRENLKSEARQKGIDPGRLIFAERLDDARDHLARHRLADLFLDTLPYNAHTTAVDALRSGLPVLTILGKAFAGRVAASLLTTLDLPELITSSPEEYQSAAIEFGNSPEKLGQIRDRLAANRLSTPLFNTPLYARHLEAAFAKMYARSQAGLLPDHIFVDG